MDLDKTVIEQKLVELKVKHNQLFGEFHQTEGAIKALEFVLSQQLSDTPVIDAVA